jgi:hypothetical protein
LGGARQEDGQTHNVIALVGGERAGSLAPGERGGRNPNNLSQPGLGETEPAGQFNEHSDVQARLHRGDDADGVGCEAELLEHPTRADCLGMKSLHVVIQQQPFG